MTKLPPLRLGVNIDHVATLRNARGGMHPDPIRAAQLVEQAGADGLTIHLREDRRHIRDEDVRKLKKVAKLPINLELAATDEMLAFALDVKPHAVCIVPEKREERTTEGGLDAAENQAYLTTFARALKQKGIRVSLFINPAEKQIKAAKAIGADIVEFHTGLYCEETAEKRAQELKHIQEAAKFAHSLGIECHAGHGLSFETVKPIAAIPEIVELNIGHFLVGDALFTGLSSAIEEMKRLMLEARQ